MLSTHGSNLNSIFVSMSELKFNLLIRVLTQNSNTMEFRKFLAKKIKISTVVTLNMTSFKTMAKK
jgi:hypothetical protein